MDDQPSFGYGDVLDFQQSDRGTSFSQILIRNGLLERELLDKASSGEAGVRKALSQLSRTPGMTPTYAAQLHGEIAMQALSQGDTRTALRVGSAGLEKGQYKVGLPAFVAGLAAWREGQLDAAYSLFETAANADQTDGDVQAAASFWAGRVAERHGDRSLYRTWLHRASIQGESFYGLLAGRLLHSAHPQTEMLSGALSNIGRAGAKQTVLSEVDINVVSSMQEGAHLFALIQIGEQGRAEMLARQMWQDALVDPVRAHSLQLVVRKAGMRVLADQMQQALERLDHKEYKEVLGPLPDLHPYHGFRLSSALVYAVARMESNFDPLASSSAGAYGMMQVRPMTASFVSEQYHLPQSVAVASGNDFYQAMQRRLREPGYNLEVGQLYMLYLARSIAQGEQRDEASLLKVLASYNAGPQAILRWESGQKGLQDPLMYIECLPSQETRQYVRNVLTNDWVYGRRLHVATPSLMSLADGQWPSFREEEQGRDSPS
ncbi:transglycosylase SLT domain-containing protein [Bombella sp. TMW 2.2559]|uniref:Transglycosylase SLT domain-containing protein n=1 Tax=Bombella dulcis TaxID=2967339 RepID=A0ABT3WCG1_9PROT|nr:transglycosylase SLT domain-containing protein [Bombella dulcis]MCX5616780.1 transglycosylase SLT domain-containing protein [Bombella dulcis]